MFLSKKNAAYLNKPPKGKTIPTRVLPSWDQDEKQTQQQFQTDYTNQMRIQNKAKDPMDLGLLDQNNTEPHTQKQTNTRKIYYDWDQLNQMNNIECEKKLVEGIVEVSGVRIKPNENMLAEFMNQCKGMDPKYIGSLLMSKIQVNYSFQIKAKALYTIEYLVKKNSIYSSYFKVHSEKLQSFPEPEDNAENYRKILKSTLNTIGISVANQADKEENMMHFVDPGFNDTQQKTKKQLKTMIGKQKKQPTGGKKFISPAQMKKTSNKNTQILDILGESNADQSNTPKNNNFGLDDLIFTDNSKAPVNSNINFNDLLTNGQSQQQNTNNNKPSIFDLTL